MKQASHVPIDLTRYRQHALAGRPHPLDSLDAMAVLTVCRRGREICVESCSAEHWHCIISGAARRYVLRADGRRQILGLLLPGDFFGFTLGDKYDYTVDAVTEGTVVASYPRRQVEMLADSQPRIARELRQLAVEALVRVDAQLLMLGRVTATAKVGAFILEMARRSARGDEDCVALPVSRCDIADYLAVSVETVSRSLTDLKRRGVITFPGTRKVKIIDRSALEESDRQRYPTSPANIPHASSRRCGGNVWSADRLAMTARRIASAN
jgi:CRP/FNR family transcriptional regulator, nitrogen fixation regulation protein